MRVISAAIIATTIVGCASMSSEETATHSLRYVQFYVREIMSPSEAARRNIITQVIEEQYAHTNWHVAELDIVGEKAPTFALLRLNAFPLKTAKLEGGIRNLGDDLSILEWDTEGNNLCLRVEGGGYSASLEDKRKLEDGC